MGDQLTYTCPDGRKTYSFKTYFYENLLKESPNIVNYSTNMDNYSYNVEETKDIVKMYQYVGSILVSGVDISIFSNESVGEVDYYLVSEIKGDLLTVCRSSLKKDNDVWQITLAWNKKSEGKSVYRNFFKKYLIKKYPIILSDKNMTKDAQYFWEDIIITYTEAYPNEYILFIHNSKTKEERVISHINDLDQDSLGFDVWDNVEWLIGISQK